MLKGLGWLGASFSAAVFGAILFYFDDRMSKVWGTAVADLMVVLCFVLLHVAFLELLESDSLFPLFGAGLLIVQTATGFASLSGHMGTRLEPSLMGLLVAAQTGQTAWKLLREGTRLARVPAWFCGSLLSLFVVLNVIRSIMLAMGLQERPLAYYEIEVATFAIYIAIALGVAFGFFWMTTAMLTSGLEHIASTDPLTRLFNRRVFLLWCEKEVLRSQRTKHPFSLLMIDVDHFKQINDKFGHQTGDLALCTAVERMQHAVRGIDVLGRWGGEEFAALLPNADAESAMAVAERVRSNVERMMMPAQSLEDDQKPTAIRLTVSVGIATYQGYGDSLQAMLLRADTSLYQAKAAGRNRVLAMGQLSLISA